MKTSKLESSEPFKMEVSPDKSFDVSKTQDPDQNDLGPLGGVGAGQTHQQQVPS